MKKRGKYLLLLISALVVMMLAAVSVNAAGAQSKALSKPKITSLYNDKEGIGILLAKQSGVSYYRLYRYSEGEGTKYIGTAAGTKDGFIDTTIKYRWGKSYVYSVYAYDSAGNKSVVSNKPRIVRVMPAMFTSKKATSYNTIELKFKLIGSNKMISGYQLEYARTSTDLSKRTGTYRRINMGPARTSYKITGLSGNTKYYYRMRSFYRYKVNGVEKVNFSHYTSFFATTTPAKATTYRALCIGNSNYRLSTHLDGPVNDAQAMVSTLGKYRYQTTKRTNLSRAQILSAIDLTFKGAATNDVSLFFYSGHGANNSTGSMGYICGVDEEDVSFTTLATALNKIPGKVIVILDSCDSGNAIVKDANKGAYDPVKFNRAAIDVFARADAASDTVPKNGELRTSKFLVITAGTKNENTSDIGTGSGSNVLWGGLFTRYFVEGAGCSFPYGNLGSSIPADSNSDKKITLTEMYNYTKARCAAYRKPQHVECYPAGSGAVIMIK